MTILRLLPLLLSGVALLVVAPATAQEVVQPLPGTTDADALAAEMRRLASNPRDIDALVDAARLSLRIGDISGAGALLQRAENIDPRNARVKAGQASVLLQSERPGQALRYFAQAEASGLDARYYAADRGLAYDLTGEQERAQRDYARALRDTPGDEETIRRYALSLGISGQRQRALQLLDPLIRKSDRAAWRAQAFVLAMTGDIGGASRIAATMMPGGAAGLSAFFERLPTLPPTDRAFAVHFGEVRPTPERLADARLAPSVSPLGRDAPVALASVQTPPAQPSARRATTPTAAVSTAQPARTTPPVAAAGTTPVVTPRPTQVATVTPRPVTQSATPPARTATTPPVQVAATPSSLPAPQPSRQVDTAAVGGPVSPVPATVQPTPRPAPVPAPVALAAAPPTRSLPTARMGEDSILARIVANLSIPASELGVEAPARAVDRPALAAAEPAPARAQPAPVVRAAAVDDAAAEKLAAAKAAADKRAADRKAAADKKALAEKKAAAEKKAIADKEAAEKKKAERANPQRIWVQVAGGAYEGDLPKAYAAVKAKAPAVFGSRAGWTTPLRATNRVLTGPFKTNAEARAFVNDLNKQGVSAFTFTSDAGQPVTKLGGR